MIVDLLDTKIVESIEEDDPHDMVRGVAGTR